MEGPSTGLTAFILAGGMSTRMGADKAFVMLDGRTLLARLLELAHSVTSDVRIVGDAGKFASFAPVVEDVFRGCGPLGVCRSNSPLSRWVKCSCGPPP